MANQSAVWHGSTLSVTWGNMFGNKYGQMHTDGLFLQIDLTFICNPAQAHLLTLNRDFYCFMGNVFDEYLQSAAAF